MSGHYYHGKMDNGIAYRVKRVEVLIFLLIVSHFLFFFWANENCINENSDMHEMEKRISSLERIIQESSGDGTLKNSILNTKGEIKRNSLQGEKYQQIKPETPSNKQSIPHSTISSKDGTIDGLSLGNTEFDRQLQLNTEAIPCDGTLFRVELNLDDWAEETYWELLNEETKMIEANESYTFKDNWLSQIFEACINPGRYSFSLFDRIGDGISCRDESGCYNIFANDELIIQGHPFRGKTAVHYFDFTSPCIVGSFFTLTLPNDLINAGLIWTFENSVSEEGIFLKESTETRSNGLSMYSTCVSPGIYALSMFNLEQNLELCSQSVGCYMLSMNDFVYVQESETFQEPINYVIISQNNEVTFCNTTLFRLDLELDHWAPENFWTLCKEPTNEICISKNYTKDDNWQTSVFGACIDPGQYSLSIYDNFGDGINCGNEEGCYKIYINNQLLIEGGPFDGGVVIHSFDSTSTCVVGYLLVVEIPKNIVESGFRWELKDSISEKTLDVKDILDDDSNLYTLCISPGIYVFSITGEVGAFGQCDEINGCYKLSINDHVFSQDIDFTGELSHHFTVRDDGSASFCDGTFFRFDLSLDKWAEENSWELIDDVTKQVIESHQFSQRDSGESYTFAKCITPGVYTFKLYDDFGDGVNCEKLSGCYQIHLNDKAFIDDESFDGDIVVHSFDSSAVCSFGLPFMIEIPREIVKSGLVWGLQDQVSSQIGFKHAPDKNTDTTSAYYSCLTPGQYSFNMFDIDGNRKNEDAQGKGFRISIDDEVFVDGMDFSEELSYYFDISNEDNVTFCKGGFFRLEIYLGNEAAQVSWELRNDISNKLIESHNYLPSDKWSSSLSELCIEPGFYSLTLFDDFGDGISCDKNEGCYDIFIDNRNIFKGSQFEKKIVHSFQSGNTCAVGYPFVAQIPNYIVHSSARWSLTDILHDSKRVTLAQTTGGHGTYVSFFSCLETGMYNFTLHAKHDTALICDEKVGCYRMLFKSAIFFQGGDFFEESSFPFYVTGEGLARERRCANLPVLSPVNAIGSFEYNSRVSKIIEILESVSPPSSMYDNSSPQYKAACWILYDDELEVSAQDKYLFERYALAVFLYSTNQNAEVLLYKDSCGFEKIACDDEGRIQEINLSTDGDGLIGTIPKEIAFFRFLEIFDLDGNAMTGTIPTEIGHMRALKKIIFSSTALSGTLPSEIGRLSHLESVSLQSASFRGSIPSEIGRLTNLRELWLHENHFEGQLPPEFFHCTRLQQVWLHGNELTGTLPSDIQLFHNISLLTLADNNFVGNIPSEIGKLKFLNSLFLDFNKFTGTLPDSIGSIRLLEKLTLNDNFLSGPLPNIFRNFTMINLLDLSRNTLTGSIPESLLDINIEQLRIQNNFIKGKIPLTKCKNMNNDGLHVDNLPWFENKPKIDCPCCGASPYCHVWGLMDHHVAQSVRPKCPKPNIRNIDFYFSYWVIDKIANITLHDRDFRNQSYVNLDVCLSPTGCYTIRNITNDDKDESSLDLGYSRRSNALVQNSVCDVVNVCGTHFGMNHPKRAGLNHLTQIAVSNLSIFDDSSSPEYGALCWIMTKDILFEKYQICDGTLLQRYVIAYFYWSLNVEDKFKRIASLHTCDWKGITCDNATKYVEHIDFRKNEMRGTIVTEIGLLTRLRTLQLSDNELSGTIDPIIFAHKPHLEVLHIGNNSLRGPVPKELFLLPQLRIANLTSNKFVGTLPDGFDYTNTLERVDLSNNLLTGKIPAALLHSHRVDHIDLSANGLIGSIPSTVGILKSIKVLRLQHNRLSGSIPREMFFLPELQRLMIHTNRLTGSIPTHIGRIRNAKMITMDHNFLKGTIPTEVSLLENLDVLHFHVNKLTHIAPDVKFKEHRPESYITDCGNPHYLLPNKLKCSTCTMCCNSDRKCQLTETPQIPAWLLGCVVTLIIPLGVILLISLNRVMKPVLNAFVDDREPLTVYSEESVYSFILSSNYVAWFIYFLVAFMQIWLFGIYLNASNLMNENTDHLFTYRCADNSVECDNDDATNEIGWLIFFFINIVYLGADMVMGIIQIRKAVRHSDISLLLSGFLLISLTSLTIYTSYIYNIALAMKNTDVITNTVILLFINDIDEQFMTLLTNAMPDWTSKIQSECVSHMEDLHGNYSGKEQSIDTSDEAS